MLPSTHCFTVRGRHRCHRSQLLTLATWWPTLLPSVPCGWKISAATSSWWNCPHPFQTSSNSMSFASILRMSWQGRLSLWPLSPPRPLPQYLPHFLLYIRTHWHQRTLQSFTCLETPLPHRALLTGPPQSKNKFFISFCVFFF